MNLKTQTDYSLRALLFLAHHGKRASVDDIASAYQISKDHMFKVVQGLVRLGYLTSQSGRNGGVTLAKDPALINVGTVVGEIEGRNGVLACVNDPNSCVLEPGCLLRGMLIKAEAAFYDTLSTVTIADLLRQNHKTGTGGFYNLNISAAAQNARTLDSP